LRTELGVSDDTTLIGIVARLVPVKNISLFLKAAASVAEQNPNVCFVIVGDGECRAELEVQVQALELTKYVRFLGYRRDLPRIYADLDIVTLTSLNEGLPVSLIEAMASGCVTVSTRVGGVPDLIEEGKTGFLVPSENCSALAAVLTDLLANREQWASIGEAARSFATRRFHIDRLVADIERLYMETSAVAYPKRAGKRKHARLTALRKDD
jgi:glycosyltransferase involved in cell wall biosynthesis